MILTAGDVFPQLRPSFHGETYPPPQFAIYVSSITTSLWFLGLAIVFAGDNIIKMLGFQQDPALYSFIKTNKYVLLFVLFILNNYGAYMIFFFLILFSIYHISIFLRPCIVFYQSFFLSFYLFSLYSHLSFFSSFFFFR